MMEGAKSGVTLAISLAGPICLWSGVSRVMDVTGWSAGLARLLAPLLHRLFPAAWADREAREALCGNLSANLLGLGNAATPLGLEAARLMSAKTPGIASDALCTLVVCNTASLELIPTTVASIRSAAGCATPFDILPAVWLASTVSVCIGVGAAKLMAKLWRD